VVEIFFVLRYFSVLISIFLPQKAYFSPRLDLLEATAYDPRLFSAGCGVLTGFVSDTFRNKGQLIACLRKILSFSTTSSAIGRGRGVTEISSRLSRVAIEFFTPIAR